eukprot:751993-Hanusia_phi.AAC.3
MARPGGSGRNDSQEFNERGWCMKIQRLLDAEVKSYGKRAVPFMPEVEREPKRSRSDVARSNTEASPLLAPFQKPTNSGQGVDPSWQKTPHGSFHPYEPRSAEKPSTYSQDATQTGQNPMPGASKVQSAYPSNHTGNSNQRAKWDQRTNVVERSVPSPKTTNQGLPRQYDRPDPNHQRTTPPQQTNAIQNRPTYDSRQTPAYNDNRGDYSRNIRFESHRDDSPMRYGAESIPPSNFKRRFPEDDLGDFRRDYWNNSQSSNATQWKEDGRKDASLSDRQIPGGLRPTVAEQAQLQYRRMQPSEPKRTSLKDDEIRREGQQAMSRIPAKTEGAGLKQGGIAPPSRAGASSENGGQQETGAAAKTVEMAATGKPGEQWWEKPTGAAMATEAVARQQVGQLDQPSVLPAPATGKVATGVEGKMVVPALSGSQEGGLQQGGVVASKAVLAGATGAGAGVHGGSPSAAALGGGQLAGSVEPNIRGGAAEGAVAEQAKAREVPAGAGSDKPACPVTEAE